MITGCGTALVTPFHDDGSVDTATFERLVQRQIDAGIDFLVPCGTTAESPTLTDEEQAETTPRPSNAARSGWRHWG
jgi:4-hydroxy-tetrahydrodipicolinate synthase